MSLRNKIKTGIATLLIGSSLALGGCKKNEYSNKNTITLQGEVVGESTGDMLRGPFRLYQIKDSKGKIYGAVMYGLSTDPFNVGDCARVELGEKTAFIEGEYDSHYENGKFIESGRRSLGRLILKYEPCKK